MVGTYFGNIKRQKTFNDFKNVLSIHMRASSTNENHRNTWKLIFFCFRYHQVPFDFKRHKKYFEFPMNRFNITSIKAIKLASIVCIFSFSIDDLYIRLAQQVWLDGGLKNNCLFILHNLLS